MSLIYGDKNSSFEEQLEQDKSVLIHTGNLQMLSQRCLKYIEVLLLLFSVNYFVNVISVMIYEVIPIL